MMKQSLIGLAALALMIGALALNAAETKDTRPVVRIGMVVPVTGAIANVGESIVAWQKYAAGQLSQKPTHYRYEMIIEDDMFTPSQSILAAKRLVLLNKANVLLSYGSSAGVAISTFANSSKTPHIALAYDPRTTVGDYNVSFSPRPSAHIPPFVELLKKKGYHNIAIFGVRSATWQPILDELHKLDKEGVLKIAYEKIYAPGERDFRLGIQFMPVDRVDAVVFLAWSPEVNILGRQYRTEKQTKPILGICGSLFFSGESEWFVGDLDVSYGDMTEANKINVQLTGKPIGNQSGTIACAEVMRLVNIYEGLYAADGKLPGGDRVMKEILNTRDYQTMIGTVNCRSDKFFDYPINYYLIQKDGFKVMKLEDL